MEKEKYTPLNFLEGEKKVAWAKKLAAVKVLLIDIDGTLRNNKNVIEEKTLEMLKRAKEADIECVITTGRPRVYPERWYNEKMGISQWVISAGGSEVYNCEKKEVLFDHPLDNKVVGSLYKVAAKYNSLTQEQRERISPWYAADNSVDKGLRIKFVGEGKNVTTILKDPAEESVLAKEGDTVRFKDETAVVKDGKVVFDGKEVRAIDPDEFFKNPRVTQVMVGSNNRFVWKYLLDRIESSEQRKKTDSERKSEFESGKSTMTLPFFEKALEDETASRGKLAADVQILGTNKGEAAKELFNHLKLKEGEIAAIGDAMNDIVTFRAVQKLGGVAVAVGNATPDAADASDIWLKETCDAGAVGVLLEEMLRARALVKALAEPELGM